MTAIVAGGLLEVIGRDLDLKRVASTNGGEYAGPCPFCRKGEDRFRVWPHASRARYWCRRCDAKGDAIDYVRHRYHVGYMEACRLLGMAPRVSAPATSDGRSPMQALPSANEPSTAWQGRANDFTRDCAAALQGPRGEPARECLRARGLTEAAIIEAELGYNPSERRESRSAWGL